MNDLCFKVQGSYWYVVKRIRSFVKVCEDILTGVKLTLCWYTFITTTRNITVLHGLLQIIKLTRRFQLK